MLWDSISRGVDDNQGQGQSVSETLNLFGEEGKAEFMANAESP